MKTSGLLFMLIITGFNFQALIAQPVNYVRTWDAKIPVTDPATMNTRPVTEVIQTTSYMDGLGRPLQTVVKEGSFMNTLNSKTDMVSFSVYDALGREVKKYLPYSSTTNDGAIKTVPLTGQNTFYSSQLSGQGESGYYSNSDIEASPLNRPIKTYAPGVNWVGSNRGTGTSYFSNTVTDDIKMWESNNKSLCSTTGAKNFNGSHVAYPDKPQYHLGASDFSIETWFQYRNYGGQTAPITYLTTCNGIRSGYWVSTVVGKAFFVVGDGTGIGAIETVNVVFTDYQWYHLVFVKKGTNANNFKAYINGVSQSITINNGFNALTTGNIDCGSTFDGINVGRYHISGTNAYDDGYVWGDMGKIAVYNRELTSTDVQDLYNNNCPGNTKLPGVIFEDGYFPENPKSSGSYLANTLFKNIMVDEHGKQVIEFKDKEGKVILKKVQLTASADNGSGSGYTGWLSTYYIYDDLNNLRMVLPPKAVEAMANSGTWLMDYTTINELAFKYNYDDQNRLILKKVPGAGEVEMVYDKRDRLVMTRDANMKNGTQSKWMVTLYDDMNRPVQTGLWVNYSNQDYHAIQVKNGSNYYYPFNISSIPGSGWESLAKTHYDDYNSIPAGLTSTFDATWVTHFLSTYNSSPYYAQQQAASNKTKNMVTWNETNVLGTTTFLPAVLIYDDKGRVIQVKSKNISGGVDIITTQYNWIGQPVITVQKHENANTPSQTSVVVTKLSYDDLGRLVKTEKKVSNSLVNSGAMPSNFKTISELEYDKLGQLVKKKLAPAFNNNAGLETLNYDYNIRGWMLGINRDYAKDASSSNYFGFDLGYDKPYNGLINNQRYTTAQYNGNIEGMVWKSKGDGEKRKYDFSYDAANRLMRANFAQYDRSVFNQSAGLNFDMKMGDGTDVNTAYDANGNIKQMQQWGLKLTSSSQVDNMRYTYLTGSNKLKSVTDFNNDATTKLGDFKTNATHPQSGTKSALTLTSTQSQFDAITDYTYDLNGNLTLDNNKAISSISYNHLNLPFVISVSGKGTITFTYDASGNKLKKEVAETGQPTK
ncbi:MAG TPA: DUF6443 domain-containing protein, partial [Ferruginibacter sp.]|nr:DUF6443 domain-containing protein [Ferruginibacter sp.]